jgi:flagellar motor switch protein FliN
MMAEPVADEVRNAFGISLVEAFAKGISETGNAAWKVVDSLQSRPVQSIDSTIVKLTLKGSLKGEVLMEFNREQAATLCGGVNSEAENAGATFDGKIIQLLDKQKGRICRELLHVYGSFTIESSLFVKQSSEPELNASDGTVATCTDAAGNMLSINVYLLGDLANQLTSQSMSVDKLGECAVNTSEQVNLDLVLEVELNVTVRFGQRQLTLREVLELTSGSVIELDRQVDEPVELLLDGKVIAKGEAVVVDGNYGLRITEVPQLISPAFLM